MPIDTSSWRTILSDAGLPENFCVMPWTHMLARMDYQGGHIKPCCMWDSDASMDFPIRPTEALDIESVINSEPYRRLRLDFMANKAPLACASCYRSEAANVISHRTGTISKYDPRDLSRVAEMRSDGTIEHFNMHWFDFRLSNICNLKCRMCFPMSSSRIATEYTELGWELPGQGLPADRVQQWFDAFADRLDQARSIYFAGGEPLMMATHWRILEQLCMRGLTHVPLTYSTNFSQLTYKDQNILDLWNRFTDVHVSLSVDHVGAGAEYIRHGVNWRTWVDNFKALREICPHVKFRISCTATILNVSDLPLIADEMIRLGAIDGEHFMEIFPTEYPEYLSIWSLPPDLKVAATDAIQRWSRDHAPLYPDTATAMDAVVSFMHMRDTYHTQGIRMLSIMRELDRHRQEDIYTVFPQLVSAYERMEQAS